MVSWNTDPEEVVSLDKHAKRHATTGKDELNLKNLKGEPQAIDDIMTYYGTTVMYSGKVVTRST